MFYLFIFTILSLLLKLLPLSEIITKYIDISVVLLSILIVIIGLFIAQNIKITTYDVVIDKKIDNLNVVIFSDTHFGYQIGHSRVKRIVEKVNELNPDIVLIPGDIFNGSINNVKDLNEISKELSKINSTHGVYASLGNHDYLRELEEIKTFLESSNIILLQDDGLIVNNINIIGRNDSSPIGNMGHVRLSIEELIKDIDKELPIIMLDHQPTDIESAINNNIDLLVVGHTHNGQVFPGSRVTNRMFKVGYGHEVFGSTNVVVTSGVSYWGHQLE